MREQAATVAAAFGCAIDRIEFHVSWIDDGEFWTVTVREDIGRRRQHNRTVAGAETLAEAVEAACERGRSEAS